MNRVCVVGSFMMDLVARAPRRPHPGETLAGHSFAIYPGGKGYNQAIAAKRFGADVAFVGMLGRDSFGTEFLAGLADCGIDHTHVQQHPSIGTGVGLPVVEDSGENSIIIIPQANLALTPADVERAADTIRDADVLVLQLELPLESLAKAARIAHDAGTVVVLNPAPYQRLPKELLANVDVLVPNEVEAHAMIGAENLSHQDLADAVGAFWPRRAVVTLGGDGVVVLGSPLTTTIPAHEVQPVDTVGAGDTFCGVLSACLANGMSLVEAARYANAAAALAVTRPGGSTAAPTRQEVEQLLALATA